LRGKTKRGIIMRKINGMEIEDLRVEYSNLIKDPDTKTEDLISLFEFFREHMYVVDNEIRKRAWKDFKIGESRQQSIKKPKGEYNG
jgi:hypothetical protein